LYLLHDVEGEGTDLLDGVDGNLVIHSFLPPLLDKVIVHLPSAEKHLNTTIHNKYNCSAFPTFLTDAGLLAAEPLSRIILLNSVPGWRSSNDDLHSG
jgi:hypothetical protein